MDIKQWWNERSKNGKVLSIIGLCCVGVLILGIIGGMLAPDKNTVNTSYQSAQTNGTITSGDNAPAGVNRTDYGWAERSTGYGYANKWQVHLTKSSFFLDSATVDKVLKKIENKTENLEDGDTNIETGTTTLNGFKVYYKTFTNKHGDPEGMLYFEKNNKWYWIQWNDDAGNPNKSLIDSEIAYYMNKM